MSRRDALRAVALVAARASVEAQITVVQAATAVDSVWQDRIDSRLTAYRVALTQARSRAAQA